MLRPILKSCSISLFLSGFVGLNLYPAFASAMDAGPVSSPDFLEAMNISPSGVDQEDIPTTDSEALTTNFTDGSEKVIHKRKARRRVYCSAGITLPFGQNRRVAPMICVGRWIEQAQPFNLKEEFIFSTCTWNGERKSLRGMILYNVAYLKVMKNSAVGPFLGGGLYIGSLPFPIPSVGIRLVAWNRDFWNHNLFAGINIGLPITSLEMSFTF